MGMMPSASIGGIPRVGSKIMGLYEPIHGSAPKYTGQNKVNPIATVLSVAMMCRYSLALEKEAQTIENAVTEVLSQGYRTYDIMSQGCTILGTKEMGDTITKKIMS
jgi:3-isopropylmalate dehydrogenase